MRLHGKKLENATKYIGQRKYKSDSAKTNITVNSAKTNIGVNSAKAYIKVTNVSGARTSEETRPKNIRVVYIMKVF